MFRFFKLSFALVFLLLAPARLSHGSPLQSRAERRLGPITVVPPEEVASYKPYAYFAAASYEGPGQKLAAWRCGLNCAANPRFRITAAGGDGNLYQWWYVGYDPDLGTVIVAHEGTEPKDVHADFADLDFRREALDPNAFPGMPSGVSVHSGFQEAQANTAPQVLAAIEHTLVKYNTTYITYVGHSLGAAISVLDAVYMPLHLSKKTYTRAITFGLPRMGNAAWANYVDGHMYLTHINNKQDLIPVLPAKSAGFAQPNGEIHITANGSWVNCPGHDNPDPRCTAGAVSITNFQISDHSGPYDGVIV